MELETKMEYRRSEKYRPPIRPWTVKVIHRQGQEKVWGWLCKNLTLVRNRSKQGGIQAIDLNSNNFLKV